MASITTCNCERPHVRRVTTHEGSTLGAGTWWQAARPGVKYLMGHGLHFYTWQAAMNYAAGYKQ